MKKITLFFFLFFLFVSNISLSAEKIVYLDLDYILKNSDKGKEILLNLDKKNKNNINLLKSKEDSLKKEEEKLIKQKNILSDEAYKKKVQSLQDKISNYRSQKNQLVEEFKKTRESKINDFIKIVNNVLEEYVKANSIDMVLNKKDIIMGKNSYNITETILKKVNELKN